MARPHWERVSEQGLGPAAGWATGERGMMEGNKFVADAQMTLISPASHPG